MATGVGSHCQVIVWQQKSYRDCCASLPLPLSPAKSGQVAFYKEIQLFCCYCCCYRFVWDLRSDQYFIRGHLVLFGFASAYLYYIQRTPITTKNNVSNNTLYCCSIEFSQRHLFSAFVSKSTFLFHCTVQLPFIPTKCTSTTFLLFNLCFTGTKQRITVILIFNVFFTLITMCSMFLVLWPLLKCKAYIIEIARKKKRWLSSELLTQLTFM